MKLTLVSLLLELNMRHNFDISPVAVIHGSCGTEDLSGSWELPEKRSTIVFPRDKLIFLREKEHDCELYECTSKLSDEEFLSKLTVVELPLDGEADADALEVPASRSKRPTRRGRGGDKRAKKELEAEAVRQAEAAESRSSWADLAEDIMKSDSKEERLNTSQN